MENKKVCPHCQKELPEMIWDKTNWNEAKWPDGSAMIEVYNMIDELYKKIRPSVQVSTREEVNKAIYELAKLIQTLCKGGTAQNISQLTDVVQSAAALISAVKSENILD